MIENRQSNVLTWISFDIIMTARLTRSSFYKVIRMSTTRLYVVTLLLVIGCGRPEMQNTALGDPGLSAVEGVGRESTNPKLPRPTNAKPDKQLEINKNALLKDPSEEIRIKAATVMLFDENPLAREILLDALKQTENSAARMAVCKSLIQARSSKEPINNEEDFIQPLLGIFASEIVAEAELAAEATLLFEYEKIGGSLEKIASDVSQPVKTRLNAIYALKLQPDMMATIKLIELIDDPEDQISAASEKALRYLGIPIGTDPTTRIQIIFELERKGKDEFLKDWLIRQEEQMRLMRIELTSWQGLYLSALGRIYDGKSDDAARGEFLAKHLTGLKADVKLWALEKTSQWRTGTNPKLPAKLGPILIGLISDQDRNVRLKTAKLLSLMVELNSAQPLLAQIEAEQDDKVKMQLFVALGGACYYALSPTSEFKIPKETRKKTLEWSAKYLAEPDPTKAQKGAEVMKKLLEQDGLAPEEVDNYLGMLAARYSQPEKQDDGALHGELLNTMAGLCAQTSVCKTQAIMLFQPLFEEALDNEENLVREAAIDGLIYIDKTDAWKRLKEQFLNDPSAIIRRKLIQLAADVGGKEDLPRLVEKIGTNGESESVWQAMLKIFSGSDAGVLNDWIDKIVSQNGKIKLSDEQRISFLEIAERKAVGENNPEMLKNVREKLAELCIKIGQFEQAAGYLGRLSETAQTDEEKKAIISDLLDVYLRWPKIDLAAQLVENSLLEKDLGLDNAVIPRSINNYMSNPPAGTDPNAVIKELLAKIKPIVNRPKWEQQKKLWIDQLGKPEDPNKPKER